jgi:hypothetical protein
MLGSLVLIDPTKPAPVNPAMRIGEFSFFFTCIILTNGLIVVLPSA